MTSIISKFIIKTLCDNHGSLDFGRLDEKISQTFTVAEAFLQSVLFDDGKIAIQKGKLRAVGNKLLSPDSLIVAKTSLRLCQKKPRECSHCDGLHLCRYLVCGNCVFGKNCKNTHSLITAHNTEILKRHGLQDLSEKQLFQLLLQNDPYLLPEICPHYNKGNGLHGSCRFTTSCTKLHVCQHYLQGDCKFGSSCKRTHHFNAHGMKIFQGFSEEIIRNLCEIFRNKFIIMEQQEKGATAAPGEEGLFFLSKMTSKNKNEICLFFIRRLCSFKEKCVLVHWHLPYRWQVLDIDGVAWKDLPNMEDIEKAYCDPENDKQSVPSVDFLTMRYGGSQVRRLSTASSVSKPPNFILTTEWVWYWKDDGGRWQEFGQSNGGTPASVNSLTLENMYLADRSKEVPFIAGQQQYVLHFKGAPGEQEMYQQNLKYKTKREIRRRPRFVSAHDVEVKLKSGSSHSSSSFTTENFPPHWDKNALPDFGYTLVSVSKSEKEYNMIEMLFKRTMTQSKIHSIQRIQNPFLWKVFQWQKEEMMKKNDGKTVNQQYLFHGTDESLIEAISEQNFDWRVCGVHGSYFARDASTSNRYSSVKTIQKKIMFVALVLVGDYTQGNSSYVRPPLKANSKTFYDSCVNCERDPSIYVIFDKQQIYPEYLIKYS
uniref:Uncharacterized protein n=1 Tax=Mola mola TaxID=94237 RepID=A0A3Q3XAI2_MOLML